MLLNHYLWSYYTKNTLMRDYRASMPIMLLRDNVIDLMFNEVDTIPYTAILTAIICSSIYFLSNSRRDSCHN